MNHSQKVRKGSGYFMPRNLAVGIPLAYLKH